MINLKKGTSIISLVLCSVVIALVTMALVMATNNSAMFRAQTIANKQSQQDESYAYTKVYDIEEIRNIARQAYVNNYLTFYNNEVSLKGFEALIINEILKNVPQGQLDNYDVFVTPDSVDVQYK